MEKSHAQLTSQQDELKKALACFRLFLKSLRHGLHESNRDKAPSLEYYETKLKLLVPLYRALNCVYQQLNTKSTAGRDNYKKVFQKLQKQITYAAANYECPKDAPMFRPLPTELDNGMLGLVLLVPSTYDTPTSWRLASVDMLLVEAGVSVKNQAANLAQKQMDYAIRKRELCRSLDADQRQQLNVLLALARDLGWSSVALTPMDANSFSDVT